MIWVNSLAHRGSNHLTYYLARSFHYSGLGYEIVDPNVNASGLALSSPQVLVVCKLRECQRNLHNYYQNQHRHRPLHAFSYLQHEHPPSELLSLGWADNWQILM